MERTTTEASAAKGGDTATNGEPERGTTAKTGTNEKTEKTEKTEKNGRNGKNGKNGKNRKNGKNGKNGKGAGSKGTRRHRQADGTEPVVLTNEEYEQELERLQTELVRMQEWIIYKGLRVVVVFEGRDTAGKGGTIKRIAEKVNARFCRIVALGTPTEKERTQWYFQRYVPHLPAAGEMVLFDRSWYNRAGVEKVMGFCTEAEYEEFLRTCPQLERALVRSGIILLKYWLSISDDEQERRFKGRIKSAGKRWKLSPMDLEARAHWVDYAEAKDEMFAFTDIPEAPWNVVDADNKKAARLNVISHLLDQIPYEDVPREDIELPPRQERNYKRPPIDSQKWIPERYEVSRAGKR